MTIIQTSAIDPCDNPKYDQKVCFNKITDDYEIYDDYGGSSITIREIKKLLKLVKKTHPELIEDLIK